MFFVESNTTRDKTDLLSLSLSIGEYSKTVRRDELIETSVVPVARE